MRAAQRELLSRDHFTVDGTLLEAWTSHKSFRPIDDSTPAPSDDDPSNPSINFRGEKRSKTTHRSVTDPDARLVRKTHHGAAFLGYQASVWIESPPHSGKFAEARLDLPENAGSLAGHGTPEARFAAWTIGPICRNRTSEEIRLPRSKRHIMHGPQ